MNVRRPRIWSLLIDSLPLVLSYAATIGGASWIVRHSSTAGRAAYLVVSVVCPQIGLWSDWGRSTALLVRTNGDGGAYMRELWPLVRRLPLVSVPTIAVGTTLLVALPMSGQLAGEEVVKLSLAATAAAFLISIGNALRGALLATERRTAYFWSQLWVAAGIPVLVAAMNDVSAGILMAGILYLAQELFLLRASLRRPRSNILENRRTFLRGSGLSWSIGATQLITAASVAVEIPLLVALAPQELIPYYAVTRLFQGLVSIASRPIERGLPDVVRSLHGATSSTNHLAAIEWLTGVRLGLVCAAAGAVLLVPVARSLTVVWLGEQATPTWLLLALIAPGAVLTVLYRAAASEAVAKTDGRRLVRMALLDLVLKVALSAILVPNVGAEGLALAVLISTAASLLASDRLRVARSARTGTVTG